MIIYSGIPLARLIAKVIYGGVIRAFPEEQRKGNTVNLYIE